MGHARRKGASRPRKNVAGLMNDLVRAKWGFNGYITSDCGAVTGVEARPSVKA